MPPPAHSDNRSGKSKHLLANFDLALAEVFSILDHYRVQKPMAPQHDSLTVSPKTFPQNHLARRRLWICQNFPAPGDWRVVKRVRGFASRRSRRILCWENSFILCIVERACSPFPGAKFLGLYAALWSEQASGFANQDGSILRLWNQFSNADQTSLPLYELVPERAVHNEWH